MNKKNLKEQLIMVKKEALNNMTPLQEKKIRKIIHFSSLASGSVGAGLAQIPGSDSALIVPIQINMIRKIAKEFNIPLTESSAEIVLGTALSTMAGRTASQFLVGWLPVAGNIVNAGTATVVTDLLGWIITREFVKDSKK